MQLQTQYSFTVPRAANGGADFPAILVIFGRTDVNPSTALGMLQDIGQIVELGNLSPDDGLAKDPGVLMGATLKFGPGALDAIGNPEAAARLVDAFFDRNWTKGETMDLAPQDRQFFRQVVELMNPTRERVSIQSKPTLAV